MRKKITLIGAGQIGGTLAHLIALKELGDVVLFDVAAGIAKGKALDIAQSSPINKFNINLLGTDNYEDTKNSDVIIITAGVPRKPGMTRDDLLGINLKIIKQVADGIRKTSPNAFVICITNPLDVIVMALQKYSGLPKNKVVGMAGILDSSRFIYFLSQELNIPVKEIKSFVLGGHGDSMVAMLGATKVKGKKIEDFIKEGKLKKERLQEIVERTKIEKIEFLEFSVKKENLNIIQALFNSLGFVKVGHHKTKNIILYVFGNVKFIINAEIASNEKNGEFNPYAFGLVVDNVQSTLKRCEALKVKNVKNYYLNNEFKMNLIEDNGQYIFLIDNNNNKNWQNDFNFIEQKNQNSNYMLSCLLEQINYIYNYLFGVTSP